MTTLIIGGAASGKSEYAEQLACLLPGARYYIATMEPYDDECLRRIARHKAMRAEKGFETIEQYRDLAEIPIPENSAALLECLGTLTSNELFRPGGSFEAAFTAIERGLCVLKQKCRELVIVTNDVFSGGDIFADATGEYMGLLGKVNATAAQLCDNVVQVICGVPVLIKGAL